MGNPYDWTESWYANSTHPFQIYLRHTKNMNTMLVTTAIFALVKTHQYLQTQPYFDTSVNYSWNIISLLSYIHIIQKPTFCAVPLKDQYYLHPAQHLHVQSKFTLKKVFIDTRSISRWWYQLAWNILASALALCLNINSMLQVQDPCDKRNTVTQPSYLYHMGNPYAWTESWYANSTHPFQIYLRHTQNTAIFALMNPHQYLGGVSKTRMSS